MCAARQGDWRRRAVPFLGVSSLNFGPLFGAAFLVALVWLTGAFFLALEALVRIVTGFLGTPYTRAEPAGNETP